MGLCRLKKRTNRTDMTMENTNRPFEIIGDYIYFDGAKPPSANRHCSDSSGSVTDKQRIDWLLQECEIRRLDDNGAPYGQDLMDRSETDTEIQSQNGEVSRK